MIPKNEKNMFSGRFGYKPQVLVDQDKVVLPDNVIEQLDNLDDVVFTYASNLEPRPVHEYSKSQKKTLNNVVGYRIWVIQKGEPFQVKILQTELPPLTMGKSFFKLKNLGGLYFKDMRQHYYQADELVLVNKDD